MMLYSIRNLMKVTKILSRKDRKFSMDKEQLDKASEVRIIMLIINIKQLIFEMIILVRRYANSKNEEIWNNCCANFIIYYYGSGYNQ